MASLLIVSAVRFYREALVTALRRRSGIEIAAVASDAENALSAAQAGVLDLVLLTVTDGLSPSLVHALRRARPDCRVVAIAGSDDDKEVLAWVEAGVAGYVTAEQSLNELANVITSIAQGGSSCSPRATAALMRRVASIAQSYRPGRQAGGLATDQPALTAREAQVLELLNRGCSNKEIAAALTIELATVKNHVHNVLRKLGVSRREDAARACVHTAVTGPTPAGPSI